MSKIINLEEIRNKKFQKKYVIYFIFAIILLYIFYSIYLLVKTPNETVIIDSGVLTLEETETGYIIRDEQVLTGNNYKNGLTPILSEGERAAKGQTIFRYSGINEEEIESKIEEINLKIQEALANQPTIFSTDIRNLDKQIDGKLKDLKTLTDIHTIKEYKKEIEELISKKAKIAGSSSPSGSYIQELTKQKEEYEQQLTANSEYITAPEAGVVSYRVDGLEQILTTDDFSTLTEESLQNLELKTGKIVSTSQESGKIIDNFSCYLASVLESDAAKNAEIGDKVTITLSSGNEITAEIAYIATQEDEKVLIVFDLKTLTEELIQYRKISFNITWWSYSGLKAPNTAILEDDKGLKYVVRKKSGENEKVIVKVLKRNEKYSIISTYDTEELNSLGVDIKDYSKISQYDTILLYPEEIK